MVILKNWLNLIAQSHRILNIIYVISLLVYKSVVHVCRRILPLNELRCEVQELFDMPAFIPSFSRCFLEVVSLEISRGGVDQLWGGPSQSAPALDYIPRLRYLFVVGVIFGMAARFNSPRDLLCYVARDSEIWFCLLSELVDMKKICRRCVDCEMTLLMRMIPFIRGQSAKGLLSKSALIPCMIMLLGHPQSHIVCMSAQTLTTLLCGKYDVRVMKKLLSDTTTTKMVEVVFTRYLSEIPDYFCDCTCNNDEFASQSRLLAMNDVLRVWSVFCVCVLFVFCVCVCVCVFYI